MPSNLPSSSQSLAAIFEKAAKLLHPSLCAHDEPCSEGRVARSKLTDVLHCGHCFACGSNGRATLRLHALLWLPWRVDARAA
jgi:hypothetical protein